MKLALDFRKYPMTQAAMATPYHGKNIATRWPEKVMAKNWMMNFIGA
jgi:hypothetical protein